MSSQSLHDDYFTPTVTPESDAIDSSDSGEEENDKQSIAGMFIVRNIYL